MGSSAIVVTTTVVALLLSLMPLTASLDASETISLQKIVDRFPALLDVFPSDVKQDGIVSIGGSWASNVASACNGGAGWHFHGILCSADGHVKTLVVRCQKFRRESKPLANPEGIAIPPYSTHMTNSNVHIAILYTDYDLFFALGAGPLHGETRKTPR